MLRPFQGFALITLGFVGACASITPVAERGGDPAVTVAAVAETVPVGTVNEDAADDPAIWRNAADPSKSLIVGTDKRAGLHVYNLAGEQLSFFSGAGLNNVDLIELTDGRVLVAASDRSDLSTAHVLLAYLNTETGELSREDRFGVGPGEGYGICIGEQQANGSIEIYSAPKNGVIYATRMTPGSPEQTTRTLTTVPTQPEGCVVDPRSNTLYIGEENAGIWAIDIANGEKRMIAEIGTGMLVADVEGLALAAKGSDGGYLVASSQGDNAFAVYRLPSYEPIGRFRIGAGALGATEETDGIALDPRSFGPDSPSGLFVAQDGDNPPDAQNFKMVRWDEVLAKLENNAAGN